MAASKLMQIKKKYIDEDWNIGICDLEDDLSIKNVKWLKHGYSDRWFADPFLASEDLQNYTIFAEEMLLCSKRMGRIVKLTVAKDSFSLVRNEVLLELAEHLSFPNLISDNDRNYIYPEHIKSGQLGYYSIEGGSRLGTLSELPLADAIIWRNGHDNYLLATYGKQINGNLLSVFYSPAPLGKYEEFQEVPFSDNVARNAGNVFLFNGKAYRPAQIINKHYGEGVCLQELTVGERGMLHFREVKRLYPQSKEYPDGFHTFNVHGRKVIIDGYRYRARIARSLYMFLRALLTALRRYIRRWWSME